MSYHHLSFDERNQIQQQLNQGCGVRAIAQTLNRHQSTISREIRRGISRIPSYCQIWCSETLSGALVDLDSIFKLDACNDLIQIIKAA